MPCASEDGVQHDEDVAESVERNAPVRLLLRCTECDHAERRGVPRAFVAPEPAVVDGGWDGVLLHRIIRCGKCGAQDSYRVDPADVQRLRERAESRTDAVVVRGVMTVLGGRMVRRPSEAIRLIEDHLRAAPADPVRWVRLANARSLLHDPVGALAGWRKALELAPDDIGSAVLVAHTTFRQGMVDDAVRDLNRALSLLPRLREWESSPLRLDNKPGELVQMLLDVLAGLTDKFADATLWLGWEPHERPREEVLLTMSTIDLARLERWDRLHDFLLTHSVVTARLAFGPPDELSRLQRMLDYDGDDESARVLIDRPLSRALSRKRKPTVAWVSTSRKKKQQKEQRRR